MASKTSKDVYSTAQYKIFEYIFTHPNAWMDTPSISKALGLPADSASASLSFMRRFLKAEELIAEKDKEGTAKAKLIMFRATCEDPVQEARLWYLRFLQYSKEKKKPAAKATAPQPQAAAPKTSNTVTPVHVDTVTMEAIVRVPLAKLASVLKLLTS